VRFGGSAGAERGPARAAPAAKPGGRRGWKSRRGGGSVGVAGTSVSWWMPRTMGKGLV
jgi:hypothetical protein